MIGPRGMACAGGLWARVGSRSGLSRVVRQSSQLRPLPSAATSPVVRCWRAQYSSKPELPKTVTINSKTYPVEPEWYNVSSTILNLTSRKLHLQKDHPVSITRQIIESVFPSPTYLSYNNLDPVVSTHENFDSLGFPPNHPGRAKTDTYYINSKTLLRTHTSAHEAALFAAAKSPGYLISADVYRRDEIDKSHYPVFHQMEGARVWDRNLVPGGDIVKAVYKDLESLPKHDMIIEDPNPPFHAERNPLQSSHTAEEAKAVAAHLKRSLELMVAEIFKRVKESHARAGVKMKQDDAERPLKVRWVEAYFPFTSPSWELEVWYQDEWLEILGCGVTQQHILDDAGVPSQIGWAFGVGLERIAMLLFQIPDIRLFWSRDQRFLGQFAGVGDDLGKLRPFVGFSKHPACYKDVSFWLPGHGGAGAAGGRGGEGEWHENDLMEVVRDVAGDVVEDVVLMDSFVHPKTGRRIEDGDVLGVGAVVLISGETVCVVDAQPPGRLGPDCASKTWGRRKVVHMRPCGGESVMLSLCLASFLGFVVRRDEHHLVFVVVSKKA
ncbi:putative mitochondrial phenylalanyl-tRNA synthetase precursor [Triangularia verruculosa]|uniref:Phenylalanine--tRNA ligase, mitochondrial n=1 Tax=Triangularia verruculosa TaxID=2587418 RepID=A0AAN6X5C8_9PEZI|nr:putative mitochondrial phenylalanyl-tRNA synthetase precursor [Triangularia verruculosa]